MFVDTQVRPQGEQVDAVAPMKLSEAIRIGARLRPQELRGHYFLDGRSCALGAAFEALGISSEAKLDLHAWSTLKERYSLPQTLHHEITSRNDRGQSRESIADWLEAQGL